MAEPQRGNGREAPRTLQAAGMTLVGVLLSIGVTVGFGISGPWWLRLAIGTATAVGLILVVGLVGRRTPLLTRLADWLMHLPE